MWLDTVSIYQEKQRVDFIIDNLARYPEGLIVEAKWQTSRGSVQQKFPCLVENIRRSYPLPTAIVAGGIGASPGSLAWLRARVDGLRLVGVFNMEEFFAWLLRAERGEDISAFHHQFAEVGDIWQRLEPDMFAS